MEEFNSSVIIVTFKSNHPHLM